MRCFTSRSHLSLYDSAVCKVFQQVFFLLPACGYATRKLKFCQQLPTLMSLRELYDFLSSAEHKGILLKKVGCFSSHWLPYSEPKLLPIFCKIYAFIFFYWTQKKIFWRLLIAKQFWFPLTSIVFFVHTMKVNGNRQSLVSNILENLILCFCMYFL